MTDGPRPSWALSGYYGFLLVTTALSHGLPYPVFGVVLTGPGATAVLVVDCLLLVHVILGIVRAQRLSWYLLLGYNGFNLASLLVTLAVLTPAELRGLVGAAEPDASFYFGISLAVLAMGVATLYAVRARDRFYNSSPYLF